MSYEPHDYPVPQRYLVNLSDLYPLTNIKRAFGEAMAKSLDSMIFPPEIAAEMHLDAHTMPCDCKAQAEAIDPDTLYDAARVRYQWQTMKQAHQSWKPYSEPLTREKYDFVVGNSPLSPNFKPKSRLILPF